MHTTCQSKFFFKILKKNALYDTRLYSMSLWSYRKETGIPSNKTEEKKLTSFIHVVIWYGDCHDCVDVIVGTKSVNLARQFLEDSWIW